MTGFALARRTATRYKARTMLAVVGVTVIAADAEPLGIMTDPARAL